MTHPSPSPRSPVPASAAGDPGAGRLDPALVKLVVILLVGAIAALLDTTIVSVAIDTISREMHAPVSTIQWTITGYLLSFAMVIPVSGWALARFGGKRVWMGSLALFLAGSIASGAAWNVGSLITFRVIQGIGGGLMMPLILTLLVRAAGGRKLGRLMAAVTLPLVVVPVLGPVVGGLIVTNLSWRWIFYVNVPICLAGLVLAGRGLPAEPAQPAAGARERPRLDVAGVILLSPALAALLYGLAQLATHDSAAQATVIIPLAAGAVLLAGFVVHALRTRHQPLIDLRLFRLPAFTGAGSLLFLAGLSLYGALLLLPLYYQQVRGASPLVAGLLMLPQGVGSLLPRIAAGRLTDAIGPRPVVLAGVVLAALGTVPFALAGPRTSELLLGAALVVRGAGLGTATIAVMAGAFQDVVPDKVPDASSATRILQQLGGAFGAAVVAVVLARETAAHAGAGTAGLAAAFGDAFWWTVGFTILAVIPALLLRVRVPAAGARAEAGR
jgi:EmrB/QacA subfamily drug resistance transporter